MLQIWLTLFSYSPDSEKVSVFLLLWIQHSQQTFLSSLTSDSISPVLLGKESGMEEVLYFHGQIIEKSLGFFKRVSDGPIEMSPHVGEHKFLQTGLLQSGCIWSSRITCHEESLSCTCARRFSCLYAQFNWILWDGAGRAWSERAFGADGAWRKECLKWSIGLL